MMDIYKGSSLHLSIIEARSPTIVKKKILYPDRIRRIDAGFSYIPHQFVTDGFVSSLSQEDLLLYFLLVLLSDCHDFSFYSYRPICSFLQLYVDDYLEAKHALTEGLDSFR